MSSHSRATSLACRWERPLPEERGARERKRLLPVHPERENLNPGKNRKMGEGGGGTLVGRGWASPWGITISVEDLKFRGRLRFGNSLPCFICNLPLTPVTHQVWPTQTNYPSLALEAKHHRPRNVSSISSYTGIPCHTISFKTHQHQPRSMFGNTHHARKTQTPDTRHQRQYHSHQFPMLTPPIVVPSYLSLETKHYHSRNVSSIFAANRAPIIAFTVLMMKQSDIKLEL